jgi:hypothetical protein
MARIYRTSPQDGHWHGVYIDQEKGVFITTQDQDHEHQVVITVDPEGQPNVIIGENLGHKHYLQPLKDVLPAKPKTKDEQKSADYALGLFKSADTIESDSRKRGIEASKFNKGDQWEPAAMQKLKSEKRACLVYNMVASQVDILSGIARQNKLDPRAFPVEGSDEGVADIITALLMRISKMSKMPTEEIRVFEDGLIPGRGLFNLGITQKKNPMGDIFIERFPWKDGYFGKHEKLDASDATHAHKAKWMSIGEAKGRFPKKKGQLESMVETSGEFPGSSGTVTNDKWNAEADASFSGYAGDPKIIDKEHKRIRLIEHEVKEFRTAHIAVNNDLSLNQEISQEVADKVSNLPMVNVLDLPRERILITVTAGTAFIKSYYPDRPYEGFSLTPYYIYKYDDSEGWNGKVEGMKDPQREVNKRASQISDAANRTLSPGWSYTEDTFTSPREEQDWLKNRGKVGHATKHNADAQPPQPNVQPKFPAELTALQQSNMTTMSLVSNINPSLAGQSSQYQSGTAAVSQRQAGLVGNERVFDNFILTKQAVMQKAFKLAQSFMSPERIARIVLSEASDPDRMENLQIAGQPIEQQRTSEEDAIAMQNILKILETKDMAEYDISIGEQALSPTMKEFERKAWQEAAAQGIPVPPGLLVSLSSLPNKAKWHAEMAALQQQQMEMEKLKFETEMQKAGRVPPSQNNNPGGSQ